MRLVLGISAVALIGSVVAGEAQQIAPAPSSIVGFTTASSSAGSTNYSAPGGIGSALTIGALASRATNISNLQVRVGIAPASAQSDVYTLYVGTPGSMTATSVACTIAAATNTCSDTVDSAPIAAGQAWAVQVVTGATNATGQQNIGILMSP